MNMFSTSCRLQLGALPLLSLQFATSRGIAAAAVPAQEASSLLSPRTAACHQREWPAYCRRGSGFEP